MTEAERGRYWRYWVLDQPKSKHLAAHRCFDDPEGPRAVAYRAHRQALREWGALRGWPMKTYQERHFAWGNNFVYACPESLLVPTPTQGEVNGASD